MRWSLPLILLAFVCGTRPSICTAQDGSGVSIENFKPSSNSTSVFELAMPTVKGQLDWWAGGLVSYAHDPVRRRFIVGGNGRVLEKAFPVKLRLTADLYLGLGILEELEVGLAVPVIAYQRGEGATPGGRAKRTGIGDPRIDIKYLLLKLEYFQAGIGVTATIPLGHYTSSGLDMLGARMPTVEPRLLLGTKLGPVAFAINGGLLIRPEAQVGDYVQTNALTANAGGWVDLNDYEEVGGARLAVEGNGEFGMHFDRLEETPIEVLCGLKIRMPLDLVFVFGGGPGLTPAVGTPVFRAFVGLSYDKVLHNCPSGREDFDGFEDEDKCVDPDNDRDGFLDEVDKCPNEAEDRDSFQDEDGCPDMDNDGDAIPDGVDSCPMLAEDFDGYADDDGCPDENPGAPKVTITDTQILISHKIYFDFDKATIKEMSFAILDAVAQALVKSQYLKKVSIEGHTDAEGTPAYNRKLSLDRALAVKAYLVSKGVAAERLVAEGLGFTRPKASNSSEEGKAINRRVEFIILEKR